MVKPTNRERLSITTIDPTHTSFHDWKLHHQPWIDRGLAALSNAVVHEGCLRARIHDYTVVFTEDGIFEEVCHWKIYHGNLRLYGYTLMLDHGTEASRDMWTHYRATFRDLAGGQGVLPVQEPEGCPWLLVWPSDGLLDSLSTIAEEGDLTDIGHIANVIAWTLIRTSWVRDHVSH